MKRLFAFSLISVVLCISCAERKIPIQEQSLALSTVVKISVYDPDGVKEAKGKIDEVFTFLHHLDTLWAYSGENSDIVKLNENSGGVSQRIDDYTFELIAKSLKMEKLTGGAFNIKIGPITELWGFRTENPNIPDSTEIKKVLPLLKGGMFFAVKTCVLGVKGMKLDIGGIAKGYAVDLAAQKLQESGIQSAIVEAGGDLIAFGSAGKGKPWKIGIRHPRRPDALFGVIEIGEGAVATSGDYQQYFEIDGKRYHHIIDPENGYPASKCISATILAENCLEADAVVTAIFVMGPEKGMKWLSEHPDYLGMIIYFDRNGKLTYVISPELEGSFKLSKDAEIGA